jgi:hypothetical protein
MPRKARSVKPGPKDFGVCRVHGAPLEHEALAVEACSPPPHQNMRERHIVLSRGSLRVPGLPTRSCLFVRERAIPDITF